MYASSLLLGILAVTTYASPVAEDAANAKPGKPSSLVIFGDSFSDNGNEYRLSNKTWPSDPAYYMGRFSNGPVWDEDLSKTLNIPLINYAYGGATTSNKLVQGYSGRNSDIPVPSVDEQIDMYLKAVPKDKPLSSALVFILAGANDAFFNMNISAAAPAQVIADQVTKLQRAGARNFVLLNYPDLSMIPYDSYIVYSDQQKLGAYSVDLSDRLQSIAKRNAATFVDLMALFKTFAYYAGGWKQAGFDQFGAYGSCLVGAYMEAPRSLCNNPYQHVFWDEYHPTKHTHEIIAKTVQDAIKL